MDAGCGTGVFLPELLKLESDGLIESVVGVDCSQEMLTRARERLLDQYGEFPKAVSLLQEDLNSLTGVADVIVARMVLRHQFSPRSALEHWGDSLAPGGLMLLAEGPPPTSAVNHPACRFYREVMRIKHGTPRAIVHGHQMAEWLLNMGYQDVAVHECFSEANSLRNWVSSAGVVDLDTAAQLLTMHRDAAPSVRKAYRMQVTDDGDVLMRWRHCVVAGRKPG